MRDPSLNAVSVVLLACAAQNVVLAFALCRSGKANKTANLLLAALLFLFSLSLMDGVLAETGYYYEYPHLIGLASLTCFLYGPFFFFYVKAATTPGGFTFKGEHLVHLIPSAMKAFRLTPIILAPAFEKARLLMLSLSSPGWHPEQDGEIRTLVPVIHSACYLAASAVLVGKHSRPGGQGRTLEKSTLDWLRWCCMALFCLWFLFAVARIVSPRHGVYHESMLAVRVLASAVISLFALNAVRRHGTLFRAPGPFAGQTNAAEREVQPGIQRSAFSTPDGEQGKYRKSSLTEERSGEILRELNRIMDSERLYLDPELTLPELSQRLALSPNHLSQVINGKLNKAFTDYLNEFRVREACRLLSAAEASHLSILGIAMDAGFNSKNAFYAAFKKTTGMTPSQYRMQHSAGSAAGRSSSPVTSNPD